MVPVFMRENDTEDVSVRNNDSVTPLRAGTTRLSEGFMKLHSKNAAWRKEKCCSPAGSSALGSNLCDYFGGFCIICFMVFAADETFIEAAVSRSICYIRDTDMSFLRHKSFLSTRASFRFFSFLQKC